VKRYVPRRLKTFLRSEEFRRYMDVLLEPLDYAARVIIGKNALPPLRLRRHAGSPGTFETSAASFLGFLSGSCGVRQTDRILDIGCGPGAIALQLFAYLSAGGSYVGLDVHAPSISWARRNITSRDARFQFRLVDLHNQQYNPRGPEQAGSYVFPFPGDSFDLVVAKSLFTHLRPQEAENYIKEIFRTLAPGGHALLTFFLMSAGANPARRNLDFPHGDSIWRYHDVALPERAIAYDEEYLKGLLREHSLELVRPPLYSYQDVLLVRRT
jgi:SAM-dependent methyltransferase